MLKIGDNYESTVIFLVSGLQFLSSAMAYNFGYEHRAAWYMNRRFAILSISFSFIQFYITLVPGKLSCLFRVNCLNDNLVLQVTSEGGDKLVPLQNPYASTVMPVSFRWTLTVIMFANSMANMMWEYYIVNGLVPRIIRNRKKKQLIAMNSVREQGTTGSFGSEPISERFEFE